MVTQPSEIRDAAKEFISLIDDEAMSAEERMLGLRRSLDQLAYLQHDISYTFDEREYPIHHAKTTQSSG